MNWHALWLHVQSVLPADQIPYDHVHHMCEKIVHHGAAGAQSGRLTEEGAEFLKKIYKYNEFDLPESLIPWTQQPRVLVGLRRHMRSPYYWDCNKFTVFDREVCLEIEMCSGDLRLWATSFWK